MENIGFMLFWRAVYKKLGSTKDGNNKMFERDTVGRKTKKQMALTLLLNLT